MKKFITLCVKTTECYTYFFYQKDDQNVSDQRPINLDLSSLKFPPMAIVSILHRISGVVLFLLLPVMLYLFQLSLESPASFAYFQNLLMAPLWKGAIWVFLVAWCFHLLAGIRHLCMDMGWGEHVATGRVSAVVVILLGIVSAIGMGIWLW